MKREPLTRRFWMQTLLTILGTGVMTFALYVFIAPNQFAPGGVSGLSIIISYLFHTPLGLTNLVLNVPLLVLGFFFLGHRFVIKTVLAVVSFTLFYDRLFVLFLSPYQGDQILAALFGGLFFGVGMGIAFLAESSTGGTDISSKILQLKFPHLSIGKLVLMTDVLIISLSMVVFQSINSAMYAIIAMFVASRVIDAMMHGADTGSMVLIISKNSRELGQTLIHKMHRGVTHLSATGLYTNQEQGVLLCIVRKNEYHRLRRLTLQLDPRAFLVVTTANEILGEGFKEMEIEPSAEPSPQPHQQRKRSKASK